MAPPSCSWGTVRSGSSETTALENELHFTVRMLRVASLLRPSSGATEKGMPMPFFVIRGTFHLVGKRDGQPRGLQPHGSSIQFKPDDVALLERLRRRRHPCRLTSIDSINLRFEGVDAPELNRQGARQPAPFAEAARDFLTHELGMNAVSYDHDGVTVNPPADDGQRGYILARELDVDGRPVSWVYVGDPAEPDGRKVYLDGPRVQRSLNCKLVAEGRAFPLFYDSLFHELRLVLTIAAEKALRQKSGVWQRDVLQQATLISRHDAASASVLYPSCSGAWPTT